MYNYISIHIYLIFISFLFSINILLVLLLYKNKTWLLKIVLSLIINTKDII
jgi:hypothetical protein